MSEVNFINIDSIVEGIIEGKRIKRGIDTSFLLNTPLEKLQQGALKLQQHFCGKHVDLCTIINARSGRCGENCRYCAQAACHKTGVDEYDFLSTEEILENAKANEAAGVNRIALVTSGRALSGKDFEKALATYRVMKDKLTIKLCASHGIISREQFKKLREAGVTRYHHNIETSERYFPKICTSHTYDDRIRTIKAAQAEGLEVCSGGIIGMGEGWQDRIDMAFALQELGIQSIPINILVPIPGTGLEHQAPISSDDALRTLAIFRFINPTANIRMAAGRKVLPENGATAFQGGASASITGNMLTTSGTTIKEDMGLLKKLGMTNH
ncbi:MAG TPA: biotin synthase BioB [Anaerovibrio sp.]|nr:biotin synthase BioB [Anaerovibrio sp.]